MMYYCPLCGKEVKTLDEYPHTLFHCEKCKKTYEEKTVGFWTQGWNVVGK